MRLAFMIIVIFSYGMQANAMPLEAKYAYNKNAKQESELEQLDLEKPKEEIDPVILEQATELEAVLISKMVDPMFPEGKESGLYGGGHGSDIFRTMMIDEYGKIISKHQGLGLAAGIAKQLGG